MSYQFLLRKSQQAAFVGSLFRSQHLFDPIKTSFPLFLMCISGLYTGKTGFRQNDRCICACIDELDDHKRIARSRYPWDRQRLPFPGKRELARRTALAISTMEVEDIWVVVIAHYAPAEMASHLGINSGLSAPVDASFVEGTTA